MKRFFPFLVSSSIFTLFILFYFFPDRYPVWGIITAFLLGGVIFSFSSRTLSKDFFLFLSGMELLFLGTFLFLFFLEGKINYFIIIAVVSGIFYAMLKNIYRYSVLKENHVREALKNIFSYANLIAFFFIATSAFSYWILGIGRLRYLLAFVFLSTLLLVWQTIHIQYVPAGSRMHIFVWGIALLISELYWGLHYWSTSFFVNGAVLTAFYYVCINTLLDIMHERWERKRILRYLSVSGTLIVIVLITATWY